MNKFDFLSVIGIISGLLSIIPGFLLIGLEAILYLTTWTLIISEFTILIQFFRIFKKYQMKFICTSWNLGWNSTIMYWFYVYPNSKPEDLFPMWLDSLRHGGVLVFIVINFIKEDFCLKYQDFLPTLMIVFIYIFGCLLPVKFFIGKTLYPLLFEEAYATFIIIFSAISITFAFFCLGKMAKGKKNFIKND